MEPIVVATMQPTRSYEMTTIQGTVDERFEPGCRAMLRFGSNRGGNRDAHRHRARHRCDSQSGLNVH
jgi:hypothetical protein